MSKGPSKNKHEVPDPLQRINELILDWLFICVYLMVLFIIFMILYFVLLGGIPKFTQIESQLVSLFTTVLPISIIFSIREGSVPYASWGKRRTGLAVSYSSSPLKRSIIRNTLKFLPWQFGHMSTIYGIYYGFDSLIPVICLVLSIGLAGTYIVIAFTRKDGRHLADLIAGSKVVKKIGFQK
ncbi:RDD family protein [Alkalibacterium pelagium]|uniref:RDD family protein n=1 Tax=Alkalibacterium pelagium TaxID=426702 RepID=A0A1H7L937_9LACT|nr:RDD family protein [Alkalibacterium pelagium]GEN51727.1 RDD family protein [Alkalibacterium pelagium]SEK95330.1 RDD family protein [Alkalibacterium pelagium]